MKKHYLTALEFNDFSRNQKQLIDILNHNMTRMTMDIKWLKRLNAFQVAMITAITVTVICGFLKIAFIQ